MKFAAISMETLLLVGYIFFSCCLNMIALLISTFYRKRLNQPSPIAGFIISIVFSLGFIFITLGNSAYPVLQLTSAALLVGSGLTSIICTINLFLTMRKTRK